MNNSYIANCVYDKVNDRYCPVFLLKKILDEVAPGELEQQNMLAIVWLFYFRT